MAPSLRLTARLVLLCLPAMGIALACGETNQDDGGGGSAGEAGSPSDGAGGTENGGSGGEGGGQGVISCELDDETFFACPDYCTALREGQCEKTSGHERVAVEQCEGSAGAEMAITWSTGSFQKTCFYSFGSLKGARSTLSVTPPEPCTNTSADEVTWGWLFTGCPEPSPSACASPPPASPPAECYAWEPNNCAVCCPEGPVDCAETPDVSCNDGICSCHCEGGEFVCPC